MLTNDVGDIPLQSHNTKTNIEHTYISTLLHLPFVVSPKGKSPFLESFALVNLTNALIVRFVFGFAPWHMGSLMIR